MVETLTKENLSEVASFIDDFSARTNHVVHLHLRSKYTHDGFVRVWGPLFDAGVVLGFCLRDEAGAMSGLFLGLLTPDLFCGDLSACEQVWYVREGERRGLRLAAAFEKEAACRGAVRIFSGSLREDDQVASILKRRGYDRIETVWLKLIK